MRTSGILREHANALSWLARGGDVLVVLAAALIAYRWRVDVWPMHLPYQVALVLATLLVPLVFSSTGIYRSWRGGDDLDR